MAVVSEMRENLHKIQLMDNVPVMRRFDANVRATFETLEALDSEAQMPPFPAGGEHDVPRGRRRAPAAAAARDGLVG